jgi:hypothetical protein
MISRLHELQRQGHSLTFTDEDFFFMGLDSQTGGGPPAIADDEWTDDDYLEVFESMERQGGAGLDLSHHFTISEVGGDYFLNEKNISTKLFYLQTFKQHVKKFGIAGTAFRVQFKEINDLEELDVLELMVSLMEKLFSLAFKYCGPADLVMVL